MASFSRLTVRCYRVVWDRYGDTVLTDFRGPPFWTPGEALAWFARYVGVPDDVVLIYRLQVGRGVIDVWNCWYEDYYGLIDEDGDFSD